MAVYHNTFRIISLFIASRIGYNVEMPDLSGREEVMDMTLNKRKLRKWAESMRIWLTAEQERLILEEYGEEPEPYEWDEYALVAGIRQIVHEHPRPVVLPDFLKKEAKEDDVPF